MMPILIVLSLIIAVYSVTRPGAIEGVKYFLVPNFEHFSWMTVVSAMGQMFYSLSIAMGILITFGSYMKKDVPLKVQQNVEIFDTAIAIMAGLDDHSGCFCIFWWRSSYFTIWSGTDVYHDSESFRKHGIWNSSGNSVFRIGTLCSVTSSIALTESAVSTFKMN